MHRVPVGLCLIAATVACARDVAAPLAPSVIMASHTASAKDDVEHGNGVSFERFTAGAIDGQFDWKSFGGAGAQSLPLSHCSVYDHVIADNGPLGVPHNFGQRSLRMSNAVTSGCYGDQTFSSRSDDFAGQTGATPLSKDGLTNYALPAGVLRNHFEAEWTFASTVPNAQQPGLEVVASPARGDDHRMSWVQMADLADGIAIVFAERSNPLDPGAFQRTTVTSRLDRRDAHTIKLTMDFADGPGNDVVKVYVDGDLRHIGASWETYYALEPNGRLNFGGNPPAVNRIMFRTGSDNLRGVPGDPAPATLGHGFVFEDVRVEASNVRVKSGDDR